MGDRSKFNRDTDHRAASTRARARQLNARDPEPEGVLRLAAASCFSITAGPIRRSRRSTASTYYKRVVDGARAGTTKIDGIVSPVHGARHGALRRRRRAERLRQGRAARAVGGDRARRPIDRRVALEGGQSRSHASAVPVPAGRATYKGSGSIDEARTSSADEAPDESHDASLANAAYGVVRRRISARPDVARAVVSRDARSRPSSA